MRRASLLTALLLTAALLCAMPGLIDSLSAARRTDERLIPQKTRTLTLWLVNGKGRDVKLISGLCSAFEKRETGLRIFLRSADAGELNAAGAVLPDAVLFETGTVVNPEQCFAPMAGLEDARIAALASGQSGGAQYAAPLWCAPGVFSVPSAWLAPSSETPGALPPRSFFGLETPPPAARETPALTLESLPWRRLLAQNAIWAGGGVPLQQLLFVCPAQLRQELIAAYPVHDAAAPGADTARVWSLREHRAATEAGEALTGLALKPAVSGEARYIALCRDSADARLFLRFLLGAEARRQALQGGWMPLCGQPEPNEAGDALLGELTALYEGGALLPNAFAHTGEELASLLTEAFRRGDDPVQTLLRLR